MGLTGKEVRAMVVSRKRRVKVSFSQSPPELTAPRFESRDDLRASASGLLKKGVAL